MSRSSLKNVMVIDDEPDICDLLEHTLMDDFEILTALSANSAIQQIHDENLDCVILDYRMPDMNGLQLAKNKET